MQKFNDLYDPLMGVSTCLTGQLLLTQLIMTLDNIDGFQLIQSNTDGIMFSLRRVDLDRAREIIAAWSERTHLGMEEDQIKRVIQKDVNGYIIEMFDGKLKFKGGYVSDHDPSFKHNSLSIVATAIIRYFIENKPVEETIDECNDPFKFQLIAKTGSTYDKTVHYIDGEEVEVQKVNRLYAVKDERLGVVKKVKKQYLELDEDGERRYYINLKGNRTYKKKWETDEKGDFFIKKDTTQNCPEHALIDNTCDKITIETIDTIDKSWYIKTAKKRINDFLGIKEEKNKMATKKTQELQTADYPSVFNVDGTINEKLAQVQLYKKIQKVGEWLAAQSWIMDGYNSNQGYEYIKSHKYREMLGKACREVGLIFKVNIANRQFVKLEATKNMNLTTIYGSICFIDPESGAHEDYTVMADGSDNLDKGIFKAETMMLKYFVLNNFLLPQQQDEIDPEDGTDEKKVAKEETKVNITNDKPKPTPPATKEERKEAVAEVVSNDAPTKEYVEEMIAMIDKIQATGILAKGKPYGQVTKEKLQKFLKGEAELTKVNAVSMMTKIEEKADELGIE